MESIEDIRINENKSHLKFLIDIFLLPKSSQTLLSFNMNLTSENGITITPAIAKLILQTTEEGNTENKYKPSRLAAMSPKNQIVDNITNILPLRLIGETSIIKEDPATLSPFIAKPWRVRRNMTSNMFWERAMKSEERIKINNPISNVFFLPNLSAKNPKKNEPTTPPIKYEESIVPANDGAFNEFEITWFKLPAIVNSSPPIKYVIKRLTKVNLLNLSI